jgi:coatomer subunit beta'
MDNAGKVVFARNSEIVTTNLQSINIENDFQDGDKVVAPIRDMGTTEIYAQSLQHSPNGRYVQVRSPACSITSSD